MADLIGPIQHKRGSTAQWAASTVPLRNGELGLDIDKRRWKFGDGVTLWAGLAWATPDLATITRLEDLADAVDGATAPSDVAMTAVQADSASAFAKAQKAKIVSVAVAVVVYSGGSYPARPTGAASVRFIGPVVPAGMLDNDEWVDNS